MLLALALIALAVAPLLDLGAARFSGGRAGLDGFVLVGVSGLVLAHVLPHAVEQGGPMVVAVAILGMFLPLLIENWTHDAADSAHAWALRVALLGLVVHAGLDGAALYDPERDELAWAVVLHRVPAALTLWVLLRPTQGVAVAAAMLGAMAIATVAGWSLGPTISELDPRALGAFSGLVAGSLLHVVVHRPHHHPEPGEARVAGVGALLGVLAVALPSFAEEIEAPLQATLDVVVAAGPALLLAASVAELLRRVIAAPEPAQLHGRSAVVGALWGLIRPSTQAEIDNADDGSAGATAFATAARGPGIVTCAVAAAVVGPNFAGALIAGSGALAVVTGLFLGAEVQAERRDAHASSIPLAGTVPWLLVGIAIVPTAAALPAFALPPLVLLAAPFQIHPLAAILVSGGLAASGTQTGPLLAMILTASAIGLPSLRRISRLHGAGRALGALAGTCFFSAGLGVLVQPAYSPITHPIGSWALPVVGLLIAAAVLIEGPRGLLERMRQVPHHGHHNH